MAFLGVGVGARAGSAFWSEVVGADFGNDVEPGGGLDVAGGTAGGKDDGPGRLDELVEIAQGLVAVHPVEGGAHHRQQYRLQAHAEQGGGVSASPVDVGDVLLGSEL